MLPIARVIGHKEWSPGRKSDPVYDMNWRRAGVAGIRPKASPPAPAPPVPEDDMAEVPQAEWAEVLEMARFYRSGQAGIRSAGQGFMVLVGLHEKLAELAADTGVDPDLLTAAVREAVDAAVTQSVVPALRSVVAEVLGADNQSTADAIVDAVAARLARPA